MINSDLTFGDWLRRRRRTLDLTRVELATRVGCSVSALRKVEADELRPSKSLASALAGALGIAPEDGNTFIGFARDTLDQHTAQQTILAPHLNRLLAPSNLPTPLTALIGRTTELAAVEQMLRQMTRLVTLTGSGGTGKTRLAISIASNLHDAFDDGVCFVPLASITDPDMIAPAIAQALNIGRIGHQPLLEALGHYLGSKHMLLVLDNFEQLVASAALVTELLTTAPMLKVLATSRIPLHIRGEQEFAVPPLALPDVQVMPMIDQIAHYGAVDLFIQRMRDIKPNFAITNDTMLVVIEICRRLDGLPLAIELAVARSKILPPAALLARLDSRLSFLVVGARDAPARQQTLRATIEWSYTLLNEQEQTLFRRLAVFVGEFTLSAVAAVCLIAGDVDSDSGIQLESLVDKNMVQAELSHNEPHFFLLGTLREFAQELLMASGETERVQWQHAQYDLSVTITPKV